MRQLLLFAFLLVLAQAQHRILDPGDVPRLRSKLRRREMVEERLQPGAAEL